MQLKGEEEGAQGGADQVVHGHGGPLKDHHVRVQPGLLEKRIEQPVHLAEQDLGFPQQGAAFLGLLGGFEQGEGQIGGGEGGAKLVGDVRQGIRQVPFLPAQGGVLFPKTKGHLGELTVQDGELPLLGVLNGQGVGVVENTVYLLRQLGNPAVAGPGKPQKHATQSSGRDQRQETGRRVEGKASDGGERGDDSTGEGQLPQFLISNHVRLPAGSLCRGRSK